MKPSPRARALPRRFYERPTLVVAGDLLGHYLCRRIGRTVLAGRIVEVEAYLGSRDPASHAYRGKTTRNAVMFGGGGFLYVYFTYGMHHCANVVTGKKGSGTAVLLRAIEPVQGLGTMKKNRFERSQKTISPHNLCNGPGKLCKALALTRKEDGADLLGPTIWIARGNARRGKIGRTTRIGLTRGTSFRWRYFLRDNSSVSRGKPS